jgi:hypothetical protein
LAPQFVTGLLAQGARPCLGIDGKERIHLGHEPNRALVLAIEFNRVEELAPRMRPAGRVHQARATHVIIGPVAIALQPAGKVAQEALGPIAITS